MEKEDKNLIILRIDTIIKHIDTVTSDLSEMSLKEFGKSDLLVRATCFSVSQIGEHMTKIEKYLKPDYDYMPWDEARKLRNLIVHVYNKVEYEPIYNTVKNDLGELKDNFIKIKSDLIQSDDA